MRFINSLSELNGMCCDRIVAHDDILLQSSQDTQFAHVDDTTYSVKAYRLDNRALIGDFTQDYEVLTTVQSNGRLLITVKSKRMSPLLCNMRCIFLRVQIVGEWEVLGVNRSATVFDKYTSCFKVENCCITPSGIATQAITETTT